MSKLNILIVEDSPLIAASLRQLVVKLGHNVAGTSDCYEEAICKLANAQIDMVITDIMLRGKKSGVDLGAYIKKNLHIPIIYQSSITDTALITNAMLTDPVAYLVKPVRKMELSTALLSIEVA